jgi:hypothetical protein
MPIASTTTVVTWMPENAGRPPENREASRTVTRSVSPHDRAALALRIAWLRVHGHRMFEVDRTGQLSAQLWDLADLLETLERDGRVVW